MNLKISHMVTKSIPGPFPCATPFAGYVLNLNAIRDAVESSAAVQAFTPLRVR
jgi:hypothetical protein